MSRSRWPPRQLPTWEASPDPFQCRRTVQSRPLVARFADCMGRVRAGTTGDWRRRSEQMKPATGQRALQVQSTLGPAFQGVEFEAGTRTSQDAAAEIGCTVAEIAKSLIFRSAGGRPVLVIASGTN